MKEQNLTEIQAADEINEGIDAMNSLNKEYDEFAQNLSFAILAQQVKQQGKMLTVEEFNKLDGRISLLLMSCAIVNTKRHCKDTHLIIEILEHLLETLKEELKCKTQHTTQTCKSSEDVAAELSSGQPKKPLKKE